MSVTVTDQNDIRTITLCRPDKANAIDATMLNALTAAWSQVPRGIDAVVLRAEGTRFCAGADLHSTPPLGRDDADRCIAALVDCPVPTVAVVGGPAIGLGLNFALFADVALVTPAASFANPLGRLGKLPPDQVTTRIVADLGRRIAVRMLVLNQRIGAEEFTRATGALLVQDTDVADTLTGVVAGLRAGDPDHRRALLRQVRKEL